MKVGCFIFARGGSKSIPKKNIKKILNKPLINYTIEKALNHKMIEKVFVSTDSRQIAEISLKAGAEIINRPKKLARDKSPELLSWQHAIIHTRKKNINFDKILVLSPTSPLRNDLDIKKTILKLDKKTDMVINVSKAQGNPWFNMVKINSKGYCSILLSKSKKIFRRQDAPKTYNITTTAYAAWPQYIMKCSNLFEGKIKAIEIPKERSIDIDDLYDFKIAEFFLKYVKK